ncbi:unnamed protein product [Ixodes persulcatus]
MILCECYPKNVPILPFYIKISQDFSHNHVTTNTSSLRDISFYQSVTM